MEIAAPAHPGTPRLKRALLEALAALVPHDEANGRRLPVLAPFTGEPVGGVPACTAADVEEAARRARAAQPEWARQPVGARVRIVRRFRALALARRDELLDLLQLESGKARRDAFEEFVDVALIAGYYARRAPRLLRPRLRRGAVPFATRVVEHRHPVGVVGIISPWNYPITLTASEAIPALLAGNAVLLKPAEQTPFAALWTARLLREAGLPPELFQVVTGDGAELGPTLVRLVDFVSFTGSTEVGRLVARQAGERLIDCSLELGGKNPLIVRADADLDRAVEGAVRGCFANAGQLCISFERIYVHAACHDAFVERLVARMRALRLGASFDFETDTGSLISAAQLEKVRAHVEDAVAGGATLLAGGRHRPELGPFFFEPTLLAGVTDEMLVAREETFGPVASVYRFEDDEEAVSRANASPYGLNASLWTRDARAGMRLAARLEAGTVNVNEGYTAAWASVDAPMGGIKDSGIGRRHGEGGLLKYTETQTVALQRLFALALPRRLPVPALVRALTGLLRIMK